MPVHITCYEGPAGSDDPIDPAPDYLVHRAIAPDARFRVITVGAGSPGPVAGLTALTGRYEVFDERSDAASPFDPEGAAEPVMFINCLETDADDEDASYAAWKRVNDYMVAKPGYRWHRLHRRVDASAPFGFVNVVEWESHQAWAAAHDDGFRALVQPGTLPFRPFPTLCTMPVGVRT